VATEVSRYFLRPLGDMPIFIAVLSYVACEGSTSPLNVKQQSR
jgi:hypothetical protein